MKEIKRMECIHVISEPGDWTRYDYAFTKYGPHDYHFMSVGNTFNYPQRLNYFQVRDLKIDDEEIKNITEQFNCNPHTVMECIRTAIEDHDK